MCSRTPEVTPSYSNPFLSTPNPPGLPAERQTPICLPIRGSARSNAEAGASLGMAAAAASARHRQESGVEEGERMGEKGGKGQATYDGTSDNQTIMLRHPTACGMTVCCLIVVPISLRTLRLRNILVVSDCRCRVCHLPLQSTPSILTTLRIYISDGHS